MLLLILVLVRTSSGLIAMLDQIDDDVSVDYMSLLLSSFFFLSFLSCSFPLQKMEACS